MSKLIFLSHIHEESPLAQLIQHAIETEFGGFVRVFVSSDGRTIPAGTSFLQKIENGLIDCVAALYLISPVSVKRNWVNFELGAVWIRNVISIKNNGPEIPVIPMCHSGMTINKLPMPLMSLNAIQANDPKHLELAFRSIQTAVGGSGSFRTNFNEFAQNITALEKQFTLGESVIKLFKAIEARSNNNFNFRSINEIINICEQLKHGNTLPMNIQCEKSILTILQELEKNGLNGFIDFKVGIVSMDWSDHGPIEIAQINLNIKTDIILDFRKELREVII